MKKNKMMRLASSLLVAVLLTSSVISGTFAKYVTSDTATDKATVAKFGVVVTASGSLFEKGYNASGVKEENQSSATVFTTGSIDVVAPGTKSGTEPFKFEISGTPEVDVKVTVAVTDNTNDVFLKKGTYEDLTTTNSEDEYVLSEDYYPVKYTLKKNGTPVQVDGKTALTLAQLTTVLTDLSTVTNIKNNQNLADAGVFGEFEISWVWDFEVDNKADTILGDLAAGSPAAGLNGASLTAGTDYNLNTGLTITVTVEQVD